MPESYDLKVRAIFNATKTFEQVQAKQDLNFTKHVIEEDLTKMLAEFITEHDR